MHLATFEASVLPTQRLLLEPVAARHAAILFDGLSDPACYRFIPQEPPDSVETLERRYRQLASRRSPDGHEAWLNWAMIDPDGAGHGYVQATIDLRSRHAWIAYVVFVPSQRRGYAAESLRVLLPILREVYGVISVHAEIDTRNDASIRLVESLGFALERCVKAADTFKGAVSDEYHYVL